MTPFRGQTSIEIVQQIIRPRKGVALQLLVIYACSTPYLVVNHIYVEFYRRENPNGVDVMLTPDY
jgi:hypothetical protein